MVLSRTTILALLLAIAVVACAVALSVDVSGAALLAGKRGRDSVARRPRGGRRAQNAQGWPT